VRTVRGFTIIEALVALLMLNVGLLGLVSAAGAVNRLIRRGQSSTAAAMLVASRLEVLRAAGCGASGGAETRDGLTVNWQVDTPPFPGAVLLTIRVRGPDGRRDSLATVLSCP